MSNLSTLGAGPVDGAKVRRLPLDVIAKDGG
jgi:hypothetical protein